MRTLTPDFDPEVVAQIDARLAAAVTDHDVTIPWAIESGSRAWGFPSPDSDYDCRFFYVHSRHAYLSPWRPRDVIETPLTDVLDVNGWDLIKAVQLAVKGNATVAEWLHSPLVYAGVPAFAEALLTLVHEVTDVHTIRRHYLHVGRTAWSRSEADDQGKVPLKKVFYSLRPAAVLRWLRQHESAVPPMHLPSLLDQAPPPDGVREVVDQLIANKALTRELGRGPIAPAVADFIQHEFALAETLVDEAPRGPIPRSAYAYADEVFRELVERFAPA